MRFRSLGRPWDHRGGGRLHSSQESYKLQGPQELPRLRSHIPDVAFVSYTSNSPQNDVDTDLVSCP